MRLLSTGDPRTTSRAKTAKSAPHRYLEPADPLGVINEAIYRAEENINPLYENLENAGRILKLGGVDFSDIELDGTILPNAKAMLSYAGCAPKHYLRETPMHVTVHAAREIRAAIEATRRAAEYAGDYRELEQLERARDRITEAMQHFSESTGLRGDFDRAEAAWSQIREDEAVLEPLLTGGSDLFARRWRNRTVAQRCALERLEKYAGLDGVALEEHVRQSEPLKPWYYRHPMLAGFAAIATLYVLGVGWKEPLGFAIGVAALAFVEMAILSAQLANAREELDELQCRTDADERRAAKSITTLWPRVREFSNQNRNL